MRKQLTMKFICFVAAFIAAIAISVPLVTAKAVDETVVAKIGTVEYTTLQEAIDASSENDEIVLQTNVDLADGTISIAAGKKFTLNLDGKTISGASSVANHHLIANKGDVIVTGNGKITYAYTGAPDSSYSKGNYTIVNGGKLTLENGTIENATAFTGHMHDAVDNNSGNGNAILIVNGGQIVDEQYIAIRQFANSTNYENSVIINGGVVKGGKRAVWVQLPSGNTTLVQKASIEVTGGTVESTDTTKNQAIYFYSYGSKADTVEINISGGTINGSVEIAGANTFDYSTFTEGNIEISGGEINSVNDSIKVSGEIDFGFISGGTFSTPISEEYCADGFVVTAQPDGNGGVSYGAATETVGKDNAKSAVTGIKNKLYNDFRYTEEAKTQIESLLSTAQNAIEAATTADAINAVVSTFETSAAAVAVIPLADYKATAQAEALSAKTTLLETNKYTEANKATIESLYSTLTEALTAATTYAQVDTALASFNQAIAAVEVAPEKGGLDGGIIALIVILSVLVLAGIALAITLVLKKKAAKSISEVAEENDNEDIVEEKVEEAAEAVEETVVEEQVAEEAVVIEETTVEEKVEEPIETIAEEAIVEEKVIEQALAKETTEEQVAEETVATVVETPLVVKKPETFSEKLEAASDALKKNYALIKEEAARYEKLKNRISKRTESFRLGRNTVIRITFAGKKLKYCFALDPKAYSVEEYGHIDASDKKTYKSVPLVLVVNSTKTAKTAVKLVKELAKVKEL
jgi:hypothetical protein